MVSKAILTAAKKESKKVGLRQLARDSGLDPTSLSRVLSGERTPTAAHLDALAKRLGLKVVAAKRARP